MKKVTLIALSSVLVGLVGCATPQKTVEPAAVSEAEKPAVSTTKEAQVAKPSATPQIGSKTKDVTTRGLPPAFSGD